MKLIRFADIESGESARPTLISIKVPTEYDKEQLLLAIKYLHDLRNIDTDYVMINTLVHLYHAPDLIEVSN